MTMPKLPKSSLPSPPKVGTVLELLPHPGTTKEAWGVMFEVTKAGYGDGAVYAHGKVVADPGGNWKPDIVRHTVCEEDAARGPMWKQVPPVPKFTSTADADRWLESVAPRSHG